MMLSVPISNPPPIYSVRGGLNGSPPCSTTVWFLAAGLGPCGLGSDEKPLALATYSLLSITRTTLGNQPVGTNPSDWLEPGLVTSNTARQLLSALAIYKVLSSLLRATELLVVPLSGVGDTAVFRVSSTLALRTSITDTVLSLALATYRYFPFREMHRSFGLSPTATASSSLFSFVSNMATLSPPQRLMYSFDMSGDSRQV